MSKTVINNWDKLPIVLDVHTVALVFNVNDSTVRKWIADGEIAGFRVGKKWCFTKEYIKSLCN